MDEAIELADYLPASFKSLGEQDYINFLWEAFDSNCASGKYQFAFLAYPSRTLRRRLGRQHRPQARIPGVLVRLSAAARAGMTDVPPKNSARESWSSLVI